MKNVEKSYPLLSGWMRQQDINDSMIYKDGAISQECFIRDSLCNYLLKVPVFVVSTHTSKSIKLPVYRFKLKNDILVTARDNFYGWVVSIKSPYPIDLPDDLVHGDGRNKEDIREVYCEGFKSDWVYPYVKKSARLSTFRVNGEYEMWALMRELNKYPIPKRENNLHAECVVKLVTEQQMESFEEKETLYDVFTHTHNLVYGYDFCKEDGRDLKTFFFPDDKLSEEDKLKAEIEDFSNRVAMSEKAQITFDEEIRCLYNGRIEKNGLEI